MDPTPEESLRGLLDYFPCLDGLAPDRVDWFRQKGTWLDAPQKSILFDVGKPCLICPLLYESEIQVLRNTRSRREIELYRVQPGEPCLVSTSCLLCMADYPVLGVALSPVRLTVWIAPLDGPKWACIGVLPLATGLIGWCPAYLTIGVMKCAAAKK